MSNLRWYLLLSFLLIAFSATSYIAQVLLFHQVHDTLFYMLQDLSFVPIQVLLVTFILDRLMQKKEKAALLKKINMLIGVFYNEAGMDLLQLLGGTMRNNAELSGKLSITTAWTARQFTDSIKFFRSYRHHNRVDPRLLGELKELLLARRDRIVQLMENPNLFEHDSFTDMLLAVFHLMDELHHRPGFESLPAADLAHLAGDLERAFSLLLTEWLAYVSHLKSDYPYLYSLAVRCNPFVPTASPVIPDQGA